SSTRCSHFGDISIDSTRCLQHVDKLAGINRALQEAPLGGDLQDLMHNRLAITGIKLCHDDSPLRAECFHEPGDLGFYFHGRLALLMGFGVNNGAALPHPNPDGRTPRPSAAPSEFMAFSLTLVTAGWPNNWQI